MSFSTCYLNSVVQALSLTDLFRHYYVDCIPTLLPPLKHSAKNLLNARRAKKKAKNNNPSSSSSSSARKAAAAAAVDSDEEESVESSSDSDDDDDDEDDDHQSLSRDVADLLATMWKGQRIMFTPDHFLQTVWTLSVFMLLLLSFF